VAPSAVGTLVNLVTVSPPKGIVDPDTSNNSATDADTIEIHADLEVTKDNGVESVAPDMSVTYTIVVRNDGPSDVPGVTVTDMFPTSLTGVTYTSEATGGATGNTES